MDHEALDRVVHEAWEAAQRGELDEAERALLRALSFARDEPALERRVLNPLVAIYGRSGRVFESLILSQRLAEIANTDGRSTSEIKALIGICIGRYGLYIDADFGAEVTRLQELMASLPPEGSKLGTRREMAYVQFAHAMVQGELAAANEHLDTLRDLTPPGDQDEGLARCAAIGSRAHVALRAGQPRDALAHLAELDRLGVAEPYHAPELLVLRVLALEVLGEHDAVQAEGRVALDAIESAPAAALSDCIHYGAKLAEALARIGDVPGAHRAYDVVASAAVERIRQLDVCMEALPELDLPEGRTAGDLATYRRRFLSTQGEVLRRVAELFRTASAADVRAMLGAPVDEALIVVCAWCEAVRGEDNRWMAVGHLIPREGPFRITHGICPVCATAL